MLRTVTICGKERHITGWRKDLPDPRDLKMSASLWQRMTLPREASLRKSTYISKIEDQGSIGSCAANSSSSATEMVIKRNGRDVQLSRLWLYAEVRKLERTPLTEDSGAQIRDVIKVLAKKGCPLEVAYPYDLNRWTQDPPPSLDTAAIKNQVLLYYRCPTLGQIKACIAQGFPVVGGFNCPKSFQSEATARTGVVEYAPEKGFDGGHAIVFTGYNDNKGCLEFQNSWGADWGDAGYGYLDYRYVDKGYADDFWSVREVQA